VTALAPSGQHAGVTEIGVKQLRVAGQQSAAGEPADRSLGRRRYLSRSAILHAAARDMLAESFVLRYARVYWPHRVNTIGLGLREIPFPCHGDESIVTTPGSALRDSQAG
jgi:hypothetical protein